MIGQPEAVDLVVDLLATVKAGLTRPRKPIASLLFIGPTGVGKTEMAKALAEFLFGDGRRLTRFDMSEYADPIAVAAAGRRRGRRRGRCSRRGSASSRSAWCCSTSSRRPTRSSSTCCCRCSARAG